MTDLVNIGTYPNDHRGDSVRDAFGKINRKFNDLDLSVVPKDSPSFTGIVRMAAPAIVTSAAIDQYGNSNVEWAGADGSGSRDSTLAFQVSADKIAARGARGGNLIVPPGTYLKDVTKFSAANAPFGIIGSRRGQSAIVQTGGASFQVSGGGRFEMRDLFGLQAAPGGAFLSLDTPAEYVIAGLRGYPVVTANYWDSFLNIKNPLLGSIDDIYVQNLPPGTNAAGNINFLRGNGFGANADKISVNNSFKNVYFSGFYFGINHITTAQPGCEGFMFANCVMEGVRVGVHTLNTAYSAPQPVSWVGGHINAFERCFFLENCSTPLISSALLYRDASYNLPGQHIFITGNGQTGAAAQTSSGAMIANNQLRVIAFDASHDVGGVASIHMDGGFRHSVIGNEFILSPGFAYSVFMSSSQSRALDNDANGPGMSGTGVTISGSGGYSRGNRLNGGTPG